jgi:chromate reductase, NAD(P)H dehydrogenase (quinone)
VSTELLLISGSTRAASSNTAALRALAELAPNGIHAELYGGLSDLPAFNPDADPEHPHPAVAALRAQLTAADVVMFCTPEYAGSLPGSLKNLLDWTVGTGELYGKPVAWLNVAKPGRGEGAQAALAGVLGYVDAQPIDTACARLQLDERSTAEEILAAPALVTEMKGIYLAITTRVMTM